MSKKKILMVHNFYQIGGGEHTVFKNEVELLRENGHEVIEYTRSNDELKNSKFKLLLLPFSTIWSFKTYREVKRIIRESGTDIVHIHNTFPLISPSVYYAARKLKKPIIQTIHNFRFLCPKGSFFCNGKICECCNNKNSFWDAIKNGCYRGSKIQTIVVVLMLKFHRLIGTNKKISYIFLTEFNKKKFSKLIDVNSENVFVKPNFVNNPVPHIHQMNAKVFIFASRLDENKGIINLIENWRKLPKDYVLHIYGDGPLKESVELNSKDMENVQYFGFQAQEVVFDDMLDAAAMIFPSLWYEGFPMIIAESLSIGCPVLSTNIGNQADIILASNGGAMFEPNNEASFMSALEEILENNKAMSAAGQNYYFKILEKEKNYRRLSEIYDKARHID